MALQIATPLGTFSFSQLSSQTVIYMLLWKDFADIIKVPKKLFIKDYYPGWAWPKQVSPTLKEI